MTLQRFLLDLRQFGDKEVPDAMLQLQRAVTLDVLRRVVLKTPVDTGRARGNWQVGATSVPTTQSRRTDRTGGRTIAAGLARTQGIRPFRRSYVTNNVPYIEALENGHSRQAPQGFIAVSVEETRRSIA